MYSKEQIQKDIQIQESLTKIDSIDDYYSFDTDDFRFCVLAKDEINSNTFTLITDKTNNTSFIAVCDGEVDMVTGDIIYSLYGMNQQQTSSPIEEAKRTLIYLGYSSLLLELEE